MSDEAVEPQPCPTCGKGPVSELVDVVRDEIHAWKDTPAIRSRVVSETVIGWVCEDHGEYPRP